MKTKTFTPISMRCNRNQFNELSELLKKHEINVVGGFWHNFYLTNNFGDRKITQFISIKDHLTYNGELHETFDADLFLRCCGVEVEEEGLLITCKEHNITFSEKHDCYACKSETLEPEPWQPKYGDIVVCSNNESFILVATGYFIGINPDGNKFVISLLHNKNNVAQFSCCKSAIPQYSTHIEAIKAEASKFGKTVNVKIEEV